MKKKWIIPLTVIGILLLAVGLYVFAPYIRPVHVVSTFHPFKYTIHGNEVVINDFGNSIVAEVPSHFGIRPVRRIDLNVFENTYWMESITLPDTIENINMRFQGCTQLKYVNLGKNVKEIQSYAFRGCQSLREIVIPGKVKQLSSHTFADCSALASVTICNPQMEIEEDVFFNCNYDILTLKSAKGSTAEIYAGKHGIRFEEVDVNAVPKTEHKVSEIATTDGYTYKVLEDGTICLLSVNPSVRQAEGRLTIPSSLDGKTVAGTLACLRGGSILYQVEIPDSIVYIGEGTFEYSGLTDLYGCEGVERIGINAFQNSHLETIPEFPNLREIGMNAFRDSNIKKLPALPNLQVIGENAFTDCYYLTEIGFSSNLKRIESGAFKGCNRLSVMEIPASVTYIGEDAIPKPDRYDNREVCLIVESGSYAERYAIEHDILYKVKESDDATGDDASVNADIHNESGNDTEVCKEVGTDSYSICVADAASSTELKDLTDERISIQVPTFAYNEESTQNDEGTQTTINKELQLTSVGEHLEILKSEDELSDLKEYQVDYAITKADEDVISVQYFGHVYTTIRANFFSRGITIDTFTGEKNPVEQYVKIDADLLENARNDKIKFESLAGYEKEDMLYYLETFISDYEAGDVDSYDCYFLDDSAVNLIVSTQGGNSSYFVVQVPME